MPTNALSRLASFVRVQQTAQMSGEFLQKLSGGRLIRTAALCACLATAGCRDNEPPSTRLLECSPKVGDGPHLLLSMDTGRRQFTRVDGAHRSIGLLAANRYRYMLDVELEAGKIASVEINRYSGLMSAKRSAWMGRKISAWAPAAVWSCSKQPESPKL